MEGGGTTGWKNFLREQKKYNERLYGPILVDWKLDVGVLDAIKVWFWDDIKEISAGANILTH